MNRESFKKFISYYRPHMKIFLTDLFCALIVAAVDLIYPKVAQQIVDRGETLVRGSGADTEGALRFILIMGGVLFLIYTIKMICNYFISYYGHVIGVRMQGEMRRDIFEHMERLPVKYFDGTETGTVMSKIYNDLFDVTELAHHGPENLFLAGILMVGSFIILVNTCWQLTLIVFAFVPITVFFAVLMRKSMHDAFARTREKTARMNADIQNAVSGIRVSKAYVSEEHEVKRFRGINAEFVEASAGRFKYMGRFHSGMTYMMDILYLAAIIGGGYFLFKGYINVGAFTAFVLYIGSFTRPINMLVGLFEQVEEGATGFERFMKLMAEPVEEESPDAIEVGQLDGNITFDNVSFDYVPRDEEKGERLLIKDLNIDIPAGRTVALVGPSGGGKTTLCHLITRFYEIDGGAILIDGIDIRKMTRRSLRSNIAIVAQDVFLFNGTVRENIAYGNFDATDAEIEAAARKANIHDYIMTLPEGYATNVGERGVRLSGGQKQRISIARAFLRNPAILILDEATSALDNATEMQVQAALEELGRGRTEIVVAHRLSTVKNADEIIVIDSTGVAERGTHAELMARDGIYAGLYKYQFRED